MQVTLHENGTAALRVTARTWLKAICLLAALFWGHAEMQCQKIEGVATDMQKVSERLSLTEQSLKAVIQSQDTLKQEHKETTRELRENLRELNAYLRDQKKANTERAAESHK